MKKNAFLIYNDLVGELYACRTLQEVLRIFRTHLRMLIPFAYASILPSAGKSPDGGVRYGAPLCIPEAFTEAEENYIRHIDEDPLAWLMYGSETKLIRESDLMEEENRLLTPLYQHCYQKYEIYDSLQGSLVWHGDFLGIFTLFRTRKEGLFTPDDVFYCRTLCVHLNRIVWRILRGEEQSRAGAPARGTSPAQLQELRERYGLTLRECEVLSAILDLQDNQEIADRLDIRESTLLKHLQNLYKKTGTGSRLELMRLAAQETPQ